MRQLIHSMQIVNSKLKYFNMIILDEFSGFSSVESGFCKETNVRIKLALVSISHVIYYLYKPKEQSFCFIKKVVPLNLIH